MGFFILNAEKRVVITANRQQTTIQEELSVSPFGLQYTVSPILSILLTKSIYFKKMSEFECDWVLSLHTVSVLWKYSLSEGHVDHIYNFEMRFVGESSEWIYFDLSLAVPMNTGDALIFWTWTDVQLYVVVVSTSPVSYVVFGPNIFLIYKGIFTEF